MQGLPLLIGLNPVGRPAHPTSVLDQPSATHQSLISGQYTIKHHPPVDGLVSAGELKTTSGCGHLRFWITGDCNLLFDAA